MSEKMSSSSPGSPKDLIIEEEGGNSGSSSDLEPEKLVDGKSSKFIPEIALICESKSLKVKKDAPAFLNVFELEKAIPDPCKPPVKKSALEKSKAKSKTAGPSLTRKEAPIKPQENVGSSTMATTAIAGDKASTSLASPSSSSASKPAEPFYPMPGRKFLPHQMPVYRPPKEHPNILTAIEKAEGPLVALKEAMKLKRKVKVWTRGVTGIRGCLTGFVQAFDRHWNLALFDVSEIFQRKRCLPNKSVPKPSETNKNSGPSCKEMLSNTEQVILVDSDDALALFRLHMGLFDGTEKSTNVKRTLPGSSTLTVSQIRKKRLTVLKQPFKDPFGFLVVAQSKNYEIVKRTRRKLFLVGNEVAFIETIPKLLG